MQDLRHTYLFISVVDDCSTRVAVGRRANDMKTDAQQKSDWLATRRRKITVRTRNGENNGSQNEMNALTEVYLTHLSILHANPFLFPSAKSRTANTDARLAGTWKFRNGPNQAPQPTAHFGNILTHVRS